MQPSGHRPACTRERKRTKVVLAREEEKEGEERDRPSEDPFREGGRQGRHFLSATKNTFKAAREQREQNSSAYFERALR